MEIWIKKTFFFIILAFGLNSFRAFQAIHVNFHTFIYCVSPPQKYNVSVHKIIINWWTIGLGSPTKRRNQIEEFQENQKIYGYCFALEEQIKMWVIFFVLIFLRFRGYSFLFRVGVSSCWDTIGLHRLVWLQPYHHPIGSHFWILKRNGRNHVIWKIFPKRLI